MTTFVESLEAHEIERASTLAVSMVRLEEKARRAMHLGWVQESADLWARRDVVREQRSYLLRVLWARRGIGLRR